MGGQSSGKYKPSKGIVSGRRKRSAVDVLLDFMIVNGKRYDGGVASLSEKPGEVLRLAEQIGLSSEIDQQNQYITRQQLSKYITYRSANLIFERLVFISCQFRNIL
jgi:hypothetical protein